MLIVTIYCLPKTKFPFIKPIAVKLKAFIYHYYLCTKTKLGSCAHKSMSSSWLIIMTHWQKSTQLNSFYIQNDPEHVTEHTKIKPEADVSIDKYRPLVVIKKIAALRLNF